MKKKLALLLLLVMSMTLFTACGTKPVEGEDPDGEDKILVGCSIVTQEFPFHVNILNGISEACEAAGYDFTYTNANRDAATTLSDCEDLIAQGVDVLIICSYYADSLTSIYEECKNLDIPIFFCSTSNLPDTSLYVTSVGVDNYTAGYWGGMYAGQHFINELQQADINLVMMMTNNQVGADRTNGFKAGLEDAGANVNLLNVYSGSSREEFMASAEDALVTFDDIDLVYGYSAQAGLGTYEACNAANRTDIQIVGTDAEEEERNLIDAGTNYLASVQQFPYDMGAFTVELVGRYLAGETLPSFNQFDTGVYTVDGTKYIEELEG